MTKGLLVLFREIGGGGEIEALAFLVDDADDDLRQGGKAVDHAVAFAEQAVIERRRLGRLFPAVTGLGLFSLGGFSLEGFSLEGFSLEGLSLGGFFLGLFEGRQLRHQMLGQVDRHHAQLRQVLFLGRLALPFGRGRGTVPERAVLVPGLLAFGTRHGGLALAWIFRGGRIVRGGAA
jgi:hypothetical protein